MNAQHPARRLATESTPCAGCGGDAPRRIFTEAYSLLGETVELGINRCRKCRLIYVSPRLTPESTLLVYQHDADHTISHNYCWSGSVSEHRFRPLLRRLAANSRGGRLLDVGCGGGHFLRAAGALDRWQTMGVEPVASAAEQAASYAGCQVLPTTLDQAGLPEGGFEVVTLLGVLEHVHDPLQLLRDTHALLANGGVVGLYVPNFDYLRVKDTGPLAYLRHRKWSVLHPQEHLFGYQQTTLLALLERAGFDVVRVDIGRPFLHGGRLTRIAKQVAFQAIRAMRTLTGLHFGGLEIIARKSERAIPSDLPTTQYRRAG